MDLARFGAWLQSRLDRVAAKRLTFGGLFSAGLTIFALALVSFQPIMKAENLDWGSLHDLERAAKTAWIGLLAGIFLKYSEPLKRARTWNKFQRRRRMGRQIMTGKALKDLCLLIKRNGHNTAVIDRIRQNILKSAALGVEEVLGMAIGQNVDANLLEFTDASCGKMKVVCRSSDQRTSRPEYPRENLVAWSCIRNARIEVVDDVTSDARWDSVKKPYRTVAAVPVGLDGKAFAAVAIDSEVPYAFYGRLVDIAIQLEPYLAVLALTYDNNAVYHECQYEPSHTS